MASETPPPTAPPPPLDEVITNDDEEWTIERLCRANYKDLGTPESVMARFLQHLLGSEECRDAIRCLLETQSMTTRDYSLQVDAFDLLSRDSVLGYMLLQYPSTLLPVLEEAIVQAQIHLKRRTEEGHLENDDQRDDLPLMSVKGDRRNGVTTNITRVHARLVHLPPTCCKPSLAGLEANDVGHIWQVSGTVVRASPVQMYESARTYKCSGKKGCGRTFTEYADLEQRHNAMATPTSCPLLTEGGERCKGTSLKQIPEGSIHTDYQEIKIQEAASRIGVGHIPRSLLIKLQHDLVDKCQPGDEVVVVGSLLAQWQPTLALDVDCNVALAFKAHSIRVLQEKGGSAWSNASASDSNGNSSNNVGELEKLRKEFDVYWQDPENQANPIAARDFICKAACPKLYGMAMVKLALLVTLIGGVSSSDVDKENENGATSTQMSIGEEEDDDGDDSRDEPVPFRIPRAPQRHVEQAYNYEGTATSRSSNRQSSSAGTATVQTRRRDQSHMLLVGDPGTGKSQFLRFAAALCPRSVLTTGVGTTSAGLTCAAVREGNGKEFVLEAGALVLADKGVCCIDEFGCIQDTDRTTIHEAMEQQTLSVAKAGIVCKLNCRATIIAVMNPRDCLYDNHTSLSRNTGLGTPLLSRFDIIFKLVDSSDAERDSNITTYLLNRAVQGAGFDTTDSTGSSATVQPWNMEKLRSYIAIVKDRFHPTMTDNAAMLLERHYAKIRAAKSTTIPITVRFLESIIRLSQAHARLMYRSQVTLEDAVAVVRIMECSAFAYGGFDGNVNDVESILYRDPMTMDFSEEADLEFLAFEYRILTRYGMLNQLDENRRQAAVSFLTNEGQQGLSNSISSDWGSVEHGNQGQLTTVAENIKYNLPVSQDHYGRMNFVTPRGGKWTRSSSFGNDAKRRKA